MMSSQPRRRRRISDELVRETILRLGAEAGLQGNVRPQDVAMAIHAEDWQSLLKRIRIFARQMAHQGLVEVLRKGAVADPDDFKGVYRLRITGAGHAAYAALVAAAKAAAAE